MFKGGIGDPRRIRGSGQEVVRFYGPLSLGSLLVKNKVRRRRHTPLCLEKWRCQWQILGPGDARGNSCHSAAHVGNILK